MSAVQYITLVASGGTPVRLATQSGAAYPTTGAGSIVFANSPVLINPTLQGVTWEGPQTVAGDVTITGDLTVDEDLHLTQDIILSGSLSGTTTLRASAAASGVLTLPAITDLLIGRNTTDTLTNKTLVAPVLTSPTLSSPTLTGTITLPGTVIWTSGGLFSSRFVFTAPHINGVDSGLFDLYDLNQDSGGGYDMRFFALDSNGAPQLAAIINGGFTDNTAGALRGDLDIVLYTNGPAVRMQVAFDGISQAFIPGTNHAYGIGATGSRWATLYADAHFGTSLSLGSNFSAEAVDLTGNMYLRTAGAIIYGAGSVVLQAGAGAGVQLKTNAGTIGLSIDSAGITNLQSPSLAVNDTVATVLSSVGPVGSHTTVQEWMVVKGTTGATRWIPMF